MGKEKTNSSRIITKEEVARHRTAGDLWIVVDGAILDVSAFAAEHPGGDDVLLEAGGRDATEEYHAAEHSGAAAAMLGDAGMQQRESTTEMLDNHSFFGSGAASHAPAAPGLM